MRTPIQGLPQYTITETIREGTRTLLLRARRSADRLRVVLKLPRSEFPAPVELALLRHEYLVIRSLEAPGIIKVHGLEECGSSQVLVLEDFGAQSLGQILAAGRLSLKDALRFAVLIAEAVRVTHAGHIIHKDLKPHNVLVNLATSELKLIDFATANRLSERTQGAWPPDALAGTLSYMSPEQTGRMARVIDHRSDLYSLGVTFYEMLTGSLPFPTTDPLELVHCHIARTPPTPREHAPEIPEVVSDLVMRLLAKAAEDRYQSAYGLKVDLEQCLSQLEATSSTIAAFPLGRQDIAGVLQMPQKLYGRKKEPAALLDAFERACGGGADLCLVSGEPGAGKSALVAEVYRAIGRRGGYFIAGKFDQLSRATPHSAVVGAFKELVQQLLMEREGALVRWKMAILAAVRSNGKVLTDVIPELSLIIGEQPDIPELPPAAALNRFTLVFQDLLAVFTTAKHPLALFLDDLQWADPASLKLLEVLMTGPARGYLLVIGAYRSNEVDAGHPLRTTLSNIGAAATISEIELGLLERDDVAQLVADAIGSDVRRTEPLAQIIFDKTQGNPFFAIQFLTAIHEDGLLTFDALARAFRWDLDAIQTRMVTDNVVVFMMQRIQRLPPGTQYALSLAACIGHRFDLQTLSIVCANAPADVAGKLWEALEAGILVPLGTEYQFFRETMQSLPDLDISYRFVHDRVQQAAYSLIDEGSRAAVHLRIGRLMLGRRERAPSEALFDVVSHLNLGAALIAERPERVALARLNLEAGRKARAALAYSVAASYLAAGMSMLDEASWDDAYDLAMTLHLERAECEAQSGAHSAADALLTAVLARARTDLERAEVLDLRVVLYTAQTRNADAIAAGMEGLCLLGIEVFDTEQEWAAAAKRELDAVTVNLSNRRIEDLVDAPMTAERALRAAMKLLRSMPAPAFAFRPQLYLWLVSKAVNLSLVHGNTDISALNYALFGLHVVDVLAQYEQGYAFGKLALALQEKLNNINGLSAILFAFGGIALHSVSLREVIQILDRACAVGLESGEFVHLSYACSRRVNIRICVGDPLPMVAEEIERSLALVRRMKVTSTEALLILSRQMVACLTGRTHGRDVLNDDGFDEGAFVAGLARAGVNLARSWYALLKASLRFFNEDYRGTITLLVPILGAQTSTFKMEIRLYLGLAILAILPSASGEERRELEPVLATCMEELDARTEACKENCLHKQLLIRAELARSAGDTLAAMELYDQAIAAAQANKWPRDVALGNELAAKFYLGLGRVKVARAYMTEAHDCYLQWGATAKASHLVEKYPDLVRERAAATALDDPRSVSSGASSRRSAAVLVDVGALIQAAQAIAGEIVLDNLLSRLMQVIVANAGAEGGALLLKQELTGDLAIAAEVVSGGGPVIFGVHAPIEAAKHLSPAIVQYVARTQRTIVSQDAASESAFANDVYVALKQPRSVLCMPVLHQGEVRGILYLENNLTTGAFTAERVELLRLLCSQIAISIENATLYASLEQKVVERTRELREAQKRLVKLEREVTEGQMAGGFAHEMRNALTGAKLVVSAAYPTEGESLCARNSSMLAELFLQVRTGLQGETLDTVGKLLAKINANEERLEGILGAVNEGISRALRVTGRILEYSRLNGEQPGQDTVSLREVVGSILREQEAELRANDVDAQMSIAPEHRLRGSSAHFAEIVRHLLRNALMAIAEQEASARREIRIDAVEEPERSVLAISDTGVGIAPKNRDRIFAPFFSTRPATGAGLGLGMVEKLVSLYQGTIAFDSEPGRGTTFTVTLPARP